MKKLGFGAMRLPLKDPNDPASIDQEQVNQMADRFLAEGFTYVDTAYMYHDQNSEAAVKKAFVDRYPREQFCLADKMPLSFVKSESDYPAFFAQQQERCGVTYFDYYLLHNVTRKSLETAEKTGGFAYLQKLKADGCIRNGGFSFHDTADVLDRILTSHPEVDFVQLQLNYIDWDSDIIQARKNYDVCVNHGKKVIVMEPVKGGALANLTPDQEKPLRQYAPEASPASWAIRFAASLEHVFMVLSGMSDLAQMEDNLSYMADFRPLCDKERQTLKQVLAALREKATIPCTKCRYCVNHEPGCPAKIAIPDYFEICNTAKLFGHSWGSAMRYRGLRKDGHGAPADCVACGQCESHCPQKISIIQWLQKLTAMEELQTEIKFPL